MNRFDKFLIVLAVLLPALLVLQRSLPPDDLGGGRRPPALIEPDATPRAPVLPPPVAERVRRRPLETPDARDPIFSITTEQRSSGSLSLGTAFSVDPRGVWITARHVASSDCQQIVLIVNNHPIAAALAYAHPESDLVVLRTREGAPAMPLSAERQTVGETGFSFGYPTGVLGATQDTLMGRSRMQLAGRLVGTTPTLTWAETRRFPEALDTLGGMSGGPMLDENGRIIGSVVAATIRRGRVHNVAPELLGQIAHQTGLFDATPRPPPVREIAAAPGDLSGIAAALSQNSRIAKAYCRAR
jgi:serine protease Do